MDLRSLWEAIQVSLPTVQRGGQQAREFLAGHPDPTVLAGDPGGGPSLGMVLTPTTLKRFVTTMSGNRAKLSSIYKDFPPQIVEALAFIKTRYPTTYKQIASFVPETNPNYAASYYPGAKKIAIDLSEQTHPTVESSVHSLGHELGHNVVQRRWPSVLRDPTEGEKAPTEFGFTAVKALLKLYDEWF
jgi:hypothetical protein